MKKLLIAVVIGLLLVAALATTVLADNGPHGGFTSTTDACANCHRAHTAKATTGVDGTLLIADVEQLCQSCHNGSGAGTNVVDGVYDQAGSTAAGMGTEGTAGASLLGGGFEYAVMATGWSGKATYDAAYDAGSNPTTSHHKLGDATATVYGSGANNSTAATMTLECTSCHDPHGNAGYTNTTANTGYLANACSPTNSNPCTTKVGSYRLLRFQPQGSDGFTVPATNVEWSGGAFPTGGSGSSATSGWTVPDNFTTPANEWYTIGTYQRFAAGDYSAGDTANVYSLKVANGDAVTKDYTAAAVNEAFFCAQCHDRYFNNSALRKPSSESAYCGTVGVSSNQVAPPSFLTDVSPIDSTYCKPFNSPLVRNGLNVWHWGDNRPSGDPTYMYRHASGDIRTSVDGVTAAGTGTSLSRSCAACHVAHGTTAAATNVAKAATQSNSSALLRMDNRAMCLRCHASTVNFVVGP